jgi:nicotinamidase-related amidase
LDAKERGFRTVIVRDCTKGVAPETTEQARKEFEEAGVEGIHSTELKKLFETTR